MKTSQLIVSFPSLLIYQKESKQTHKAGNEYEASSPLSPIKGSRSEVNVNGNIMETWLLVIFPMEIPNKELSKYYFSCKYHKDICCSAQRQENKMEKKKDRAEKGKQSRKGCGADCGWEILEDTNVQKQEKSSGTQTELQRMGKIENYTRNEWKGGK